MWQETYRLVGSQDKWYKILSTGAQVGKVERAVGDRGVGSPRSRPVGKLTERQCTLT